MFTKNNIISNVQYILDPMSVIVVLATNAFKPIGTKLGVYQGRLYLQNAGILQSTVRTFNGDTKTNIKVLYSPTIYACKHFYKCMQANEDKSKLAELTFLFTKAKEGLDNLSQTYCDDREVRSQINTYINMIQSTLTNPNSYDFLDMLLHIKNRENEPDNADEIKTNMIDELFKQWDANKIRLAISLIREMEDANSNGRNQLFIAIESFMTYMYDKTKLISVVEGI